eukprot:693159-Pyramimonas_sp.AAC.1
MTSKRAGASGPLVAGGGSDEVHRGEVGPDSLAVGRACPPTGGCWAEKKYPKKKYSQNAQQHTTI